MFQELHDLWEVHIQSIREVYWLLRYVIVHVKTQSELAVSSGLNYLIPRYNEHTLTVPISPCSHLSKGTDAMISAHTLTQVGSYKEVLSPCSSLQSFSMAILPPP